MRTLAVLLFAAVLALAAGKKPVTLEVAARPPAEGIGRPVWSPDGKSFVYSMRKSVWLFDAFRNAKREIASLEPLEKAAIKRPADAPFEWENRRVSNERIQWTPDGKKLLLLVEGDLFLWDIASGNWEQLTATPEVEGTPKISPDGRAVSFQRANELHVLDIATHKVKRLTQGSSETLWNARLDWVYPEELDLGSAHWWSPDSKHIAFLQFDVSKQWIYPHANLLDIKALYEPQRYPKAGTPNADVRLGVIPAGGGKVKWMDLGERGALLARIDWLPDSRRIAVQRLNRVQNELSLLFADASSGAARTVLEEKDRYWVNVSDDLRFLVGRDQFLWSSERDGFRHLYLYSNDGTQQKRLTAGEWETRGITGIDEERGTVYFHSKQRGPLGQDLASVSLDGGDIRLVTQAKGQHSVSVAPRAGYYVDTFSNLTQPARKTLNRISGEEIAVLQAPGAAAGEFEFLAPEIVEVKASDGDLMYARLVKPANFDASKKYPAVVMVYGGPHAQSVCDCYGGLGWEQALAQSGFVIWQLDNRGTSGRGHAWETRLYRRFGKQELSDQEEGIRHLVALGFVDPKRIGMYGWSYGGFMTMYTLLNSPGLLRAAIAGAPVTDWRNYDTIYTERYLGLPAENEEGYKASSPVNNAANLDAKLMVAHNIGDDNVLYQQSFQMIVALEKAGKQYETVIYPQRTHGVTGSYRRHLLEATTAFFERNLK